MTIQSITSEQYTEGQERQLVRMAEDAARNATRAVFENVPPSKDGAQFLIGGVWSASLTQDFATAIRKRAQAFSNMIVRHVTVNRGRTPLEVLSAAANRLQVYSLLVNTMPRGEEDEVDVFFFKLDLPEDRGGMSYDYNDLDREFELRWLVPVDSYSLAKVNEDDPHFAERYPNMTYWRDANGSLVYMAFPGWDRGQVVRVRYTSVYCGTGLWFAGVQKK